MVPLNSPDDTPIVQLYRRFDADGRVRWVGVSRDAARRSYRDWAHRYDPELQRGNPRLAEWLRDLDRPPRIEVICEVPYALRHLVEGAAILAYRQAGHPLLNIRIGQQQPPETRARIAEGMRRYRSRQRAAASA
ncbi:hypothetical protein [Streptomyces wuyuanensis]|uniref:hypothetical protein n=1 Tax=Streptomyces wuyuanensis TaxID=1196353 RepID=UPI00341C5472